MGLLAIHADHQQMVHETIRAVLSHFDSQSLDQADSEMLRAASDRAYSDEILLEKFRLWLEEREDDVLLFHVRRFFDQEKLPKLSAEEQNQSSRREAVESEIKARARDRVKQIFSHRLTALAAERGLDTNGKLGEFLGVSEEQARKWRSGENKPQLATLRAIADKFKVRLEYLSGHIDAP